MKTIYTIVIPGPPIPLARPRLGKWGVYDSQKLLKKNTICHVLQQKGQWKKIDGPIGMHIEFRMPIPKMSQEKMEKRLKSYHIMRPDVSNMIKYVEDCLQGNVFDDDCQIVEITARKINSLVPETIVKIWSENASL